MANKITKGIIVTIVTIATAVHFSYGQLSQRNTPYTFGQSNQNVGGIGIGFFQNPNPTQPPQDFPRAALHVNTNYLGTNNGNFGAGEVFLTNCPANSSTNVINAWRMQKAGSPMGMLFNYGFNTVVADRNDFSLQATSGAMTFHTGTSNADGVAPEHLRISSTVAGNIGIIGDNDIAGTTTNNKVDVTQYFSASPPTFNLEIRGKTGLRIFNGIRTPSTTNPLGDFGGNLDLWSSGTGETHIQWASSGTISSIDGQSGQFQINSNRPIVFRKSNIEAVHIANSGNVGMGTGFITTTDPTTTNPPSERLDVNGNARIRAISYGTNNFLVTGQANGTLHKLDFTNNQTKFLREDGNWAAPTDNDWNFTTNQPNMFSMPAGNVGIGDATPISKLTVGDGDKFQVSTTGNLKTINGVDNYTWPTAHSTGFLRNDGNGNLSWAMVSGGGTGGGSLWVEGTTRYGQHGNFDIFYNGRAVVGLEVVNSPFSGMADEDIFSVGISPAYGFFKVSYNGNISEIRGLKYSWPQVGHNPQADGIMDKVLTYSADGTNGEMSLVWRLPTPGSSDKGWYNNAGNLYAGGGKGEVGDYTNEGGIIIGVKEAESYYPFSGNQSTKLFVKATAPSGQTANGLFVLNDVSGTNRQGAEIRVRGNGSISSCKGLVLNVVSDLPSLNYGLYTYSKQYANNKNCAGYFNAEIGAGNTNDYENYSIWVENGKVRKPGGGTWEETSDQRVKKDIESFTDGIEKIRQLNPVSFKFNGMAGIKEAGTHQGFIAQDIKDIIPYTISTYNAKLDTSDATETELYSYNANALLYVMVNALKQTDADMQSVKDSISFYRTEFNNLKNEFNDFKNQARYNDTTQQVGNQRKSRKEVNNIEEQDPKLFDCRPNPFRNSTIIDYYLPENADPSFICINDLQGKQIQKIKLFSFGKNNIEIYKKDLYAGIFIYSLISGDKIIASKQMVVLD